MDYLLSIDISKMPQKPGKNNFHLFFKKKLKKDISTP